jgi:RHS repeat-associated protein
MRNVCETGAVPGARKSDPETGLYYYRARYYDPIPGRFLSEDPLGFDGDGTDFYAYVGNSPVRNIDPFGLARCFFSLGALGENGVIICYPDKPGQDPLLFPANSGNNGDPEHSCQNHPRCPPNAHGPLPLGPYKFGRPSASHRAKDGSVNGIHLIPTGPINQYGADGRFLTHWCVKGWDNQQVPFKNGHFCSEGCIVSAPDNIRALNNLLSKEPGSTLNVIY